MIQQINMMKINYYFTTNVGVCYMTYRLGQFSFPLNFESNLNKYFLMLNLNITGFIKFTFYFLNRFFSPTCLISYTFKITQVNVFALKLDKVLFLTN